jgi:hypothetical protein
MCEGSSGVCCPRWSANRGKHTLSGRQTKFRDLLKQIGLDEQLALEAQHIGAMPERLSAAAAAGVLQ